MAFKTRYSYFKYPVIPFRQTNTSVTFQSNINKILTRKLKVFIIIYLNSILIYTKSKGKNKWKLFDGY